MQLEFGSISTALTILSAMITPTVLISACGSLAISTASRANRVNDRARQVAGELAELAGVAGNGETVEEERTLLFDQLNGDIKRTRILQRTLSALYLAIGFFVATSVAIGLAAFVGVLGWLPLFLGIIGGALLFYATVLLIIDSAQGLTIVYGETELILRYGERSLERAQERLAEREQSCDQE